VVKDCRANWLMRVWILVWLLWLAFSGLSGAADLVLEGQQTQGGLIKGRASPGSRVWLDDTEIRVAPDGHFLIGFGRDASRSAALRIRKPDGSDKLVRVEIAPRDYIIQRIDGLPPRKVTPKPADLKRIRADSAAIGKARRRDDPRTDFLSGWEWPVTGRISGVYGSQRVLNGKPKRPHFGVDIAAQRGTPVRAPADGLVTLLHPDMFYSGVTLLLDHGLGLSTVYLHLKRSLVRKGERVRRGQVIAEVGSTGRATGPHLHWGMNLFNTRLDPSLLVGPMPSAIASN